MPPNSNVTRLHSDAQDNQAGGHGDAGPSKQLLPVNAVHEGGDGQVAGSETRLWIKLSMD